MGYCRIITDCLDSTRNHLEKTQYFQGEASALALFY